ncbi:MAG: outer membrane protein assembly factor BamA [Pseudomonadota bacterium]
MIRLRSLIIVIAAIFGSVLGAVEAQDRQLIQSVRIVGNERIEAGTVASYLVLGAGDVADQRLIDLSLKTLFRTGLFADAAITIDDGLMTVEVQENPIVNRVIFEGNKRTKEDKFTEEIQLAPRIVYTRAKVQSDVARMLEVYRRSGRFGAQITPKVRQLPQNRVDVIFEIDEGPKTGIVKVNFVGNEVYTDAELKKQILTTEGRWWKIFASQNNYDPDRIEYERDLLRQFYAKNGYADFQVVSAIAELTPDRKNFFVTFTVEEGRKYNFGEINVETTLDKLDSRVLERIVRIQPGQQYNADRIDSASESIQFATGVQGYAFVDVYPRIQTRPEEGVVDVTFEVNEGPRVYVERVQIGGNTRTIDEVIRREMRIAEGDAFNRVLVDRSRVRIRGLGYFGEVSIEELPGSAPDRTVLDVQVQERSTGSFTVGVGVSSTDNFTTDFSIVEQNWLGRGQFARFRVAASSRQRTIDLSFREPYLFGRNLSGGFELFNVLTDFRESGFESLTIGAGVNTGFALSEYGRVGLRYTIRQDDVTLDDGLARALGCIDGNGQDTVLAFLNPTCASAGDRLASTVGYTVSFDRRNDPILPTNGWRFSLSQNFAGVGGDRNNIRTELSGAYYKRLYRGFIGQLALRSGYVEGLGGDRLLTNDRFYIGASRFRGFEVAGVGPRFISALGTFNEDPDLNTRTPSIITGTQAIGAKLYAVGTAEVRLPLPVGPEYGLRATVFTDFGTVGLLDDEDKELNDEQFRDQFFVDVNGDLILEGPVQDDLSFRYSAGFTVSWDSPFGPIRFDFAEVFKRELYDRTEGFRFSAGTSF